MSLTVFGDAARFAAFGQNAARLKTDLQTLSAEVASGRRADVGKAVGGDFALLSDIRRGLRLSESVAEGLARAAALAEGRQAALDRLAGEIDGAAPALLAVAGSGNASDLQIRLAEAPDRLAQAVDIMNTRLAGTSLFSGDAPDRPAMVDAEAMLAALRPLVTGAPDAAAALALIDDWFLAPGSGFETVAWTGGTATGGTVHLGEGRRLEAGVSALEPSVRTTLAGLAAAALAAEGSLPGGTDALATMTTGAATRMLSGADGLVDLRARLGLAESRIEEARVTVETRRAAFEMEEARLVSADPYDAATRIEAVSRQLESLFLLTARISRLTLTDVLR